MKKLFALLLFVSTFAFGQSYPSPTYNVLTLQTPLAVTSGGTNSATATGATSNLQYLQGATGSVAISDTAKFQQVVNAADFGALCNGVHVDTANIQAAVNTGFQVHLPTGTCVVTDAINMTTADQVIAGDGRQRTTVSVPNTFNLSAAGVFVATPSQEGPTFRDFTVIFAQPDTAVRANLVNYPPAFMLRSASRFRLQHMRIALAMTGIDLAAGTNSGGAVMEDLELSAFNVGITIDGSQDSIRIDKLHFWPFGVGPIMTTNQQSIFFDGNTIGLLSGRDDDLHLTDSLFINGGAEVKFITTGSGSTFADINNTDFDNFTGIVMQSGQVSVSDSFFSEGVAGAQAIIQTGGDLRVGTSKFFAGIATTNPMVQLSSGAGFMQITGSYFNVVGDMTAISAANGGSGVGTLILNGNQFNAPQNTSPVNPLVNAATGGRLTATGNRVTDKGTGTGTFINVAVDDGHVISGNAAEGWGITLPGTLSSAVAYGNSGTTGLVNHFIGSLSAATINATSNARLQYRNISGQSIATGTPTTVTGWTSVFDANANFVPSTGIFTAPVGGYYQITAQMALNLAGTIALNNQFVVNIIANSATVATCTFEIAYTTEQLATQACGAAVNLAAGQTASVQVSQTTGSAQTLNTGAAANTINILQAP